MILGGRLLVHAVLAAAFSPGLDVVCHVPNYLFDVEHAQRCLNVLVVETLNEVAVQQEHLSFEMGRGL